MPQCQRSPGFNTRLDKLPPTAGVWTCPGESYGAKGCAGGETYELVSDALHLTAARDVIAETELEFGRSAPTTKLCLLWGEGPQHIVHSGVSEVYIEREAQGEPRFFWQIPHEVFHHVCTPPALLHWSHEMLAMLWAVKYLEKTGRQALAHEFKVNELSKKDQCPIEIMLGIKTLPFPDGFYGQALSTGLALEAELGWEDLKRLCGSFDAAGQPDIATWQATLDERSAKVDAILIGG